MRRKATGPDGMATEMLREMEEDSREEILKILNDLWKGERLEPKIS